MATIEVERTIEEIPTQEVDQISLDLEKAADLIEQEGWCRNLLSIDDNGKKNRCLVGAVYYAAYGKDTTEATVDTALEIKDHLFRLGFNFMHKESFTAYADKSGKFAWQFNDESEDAQAVIRRLREGAANANGIAR